VPVLCLDPENVPLHKLLGVTQAHTGAHNHMYQSGSCFRGPQTLEGDDDVNEGDLSHRSNTGVSAQDLYALL
jgi:hypothetical protein